MTQKLIIGRTGKFTIQDGDTQIVLDTVEKVLPFLNQTNFELEKNFSLRSYFLIFKNYPMLVHLEDWIPEYLDAFNSVRGIGCIDMEMPRAFINVKELVTINKIVSGDEFYESSVDVSVIDPSQEDISYAIEYMELDKILDMTIKISEFAELKEVFNDNPQAKCLERSKVKNKSGIKLIDFLSRIIYEISFLGLPEEKAEAMQEIDNLVDEANKMVNLTLIDK